jgi:hypothetical protein
MTSYAFDLSGPTGPGGRLGHLGPQILIGSILASIALVLRPLPSDTAASTLLPVGLLVTVVASWLLMRSHDRRLCERCMVSMPLNAPEVAARQFRRFAVTHLGADARAVVGYLVVLLGSSVLLAEPGLLPGASGEYVWAAVQSTMVYLVLCYSAHRRLQPWCPWCSGDGGGEHRDTDTPRPAPSGSSLH